MEPKEQVAEEPTTKLFAKPKPKATVATKDEHAHHAASLGSNNFH